MLVVPAALMIIAGCSGGPTCGMAEPTAAVLDLRTADWFASYPDSTLRVCFDSACQSITGTSIGAKARTLRLVGTTPVRRLHRGSELRLSASAKLDQPQRTQNLQGIQVKVRHMTGCPDLWLATASVSTTGALGTQEP